MVGNSIGQRVGLVACIALLLIAGATADEMPSDRGSPGAPVNIAPSAPRAEETAFLSESGAAMDRMMAAMTITPSGDVDADFAAAMIPHHQGAIDMALAELRHGKNEQLRRIAQEIIVDQQQEIAAMRLALGQTPPTPMAAPTQGGSTAGTDAGSPVSHSHQH